MIPTNEKCRAQPIRPEPPRALLAGLRRGPERNLSPVRMEILAEIKDFQAVPGGAAGHRDLVTRLEFLAVPAISDKVIRRRHFDGPFHDAAIFVLHFESDQRVRLDKMELLHGSL